MSTASVAPQSATKTARSERKVRLDMDALGVESFATNARGGVFGHMPGTFACPTAFDCETNGGAFTCGVCLDTQVECSGQSQCLSQTCGEYTGPEVCISACGAESCIGIC